MRFEAMVNWTVNLGAGWSSYFVNNTIPKINIFSYQDKSISNFAKIPLLLGFNYNDKNFWAGHFSIMVEEFKEEVFFLPAQILEEHLKEWQGIIGKNTLSPRLYYAGINDLETFIHGHPDCAFVKIDIFDEIKKEFLNSLNAQPDFALENLQADLEEGLAGLYEGKYEFADLVMRASFYKNILPKDLYKKIITYLNELNKKIIIPSSFGLNNGFQINSDLTIKYQRYLGALHTLLSDYANQIPNNSKEIQEHVDLTTHNSSTTTNEGSSYWQWGCQQIYNFACYIREHPFQAFTAGLALQATAVAAIEPLYSSRSISKRGLTDEFRVNTYTQGAQEYPAVVKRADGGFGVFWQSYGQDSSGYGIFGKFFDSNGNLVKDDFQINTLILNNQTFHSLPTSDALYAEFNSGEYKLNTRPISTLTDGNTIVGYQSIDISSDWNVFGQQLNSTGNINTNEFQMNTIVSNEQAGLSVTALANNTFLTTWISYKPYGSGTYIVQAQLYQAQNNATNIPQRIGTEFQASIDTPLIQFGGASTLLNNGNFVTVWSSIYISGGSPVLGQIFSPILDTNNIPTRVGTVFQANTYTGSGTVQCEPSIAVLPNGNFVIVWQSAGQDTFESTGIYGQIFSPTLNGANTPTKIGTEFQVNTYTTNNQFIPCIATFPNNNFIVAWTSDGQDGSGYGVYAQFFSSNLNGGNVPTKIQSEFRVNSYTSGHQLKPAIVSLSNDSFVSIWQSFGQDGSDYGIYGRILFSQLSAQNTNKNRIYIEDQALDLSDIIINQPFYYTNQQVSLGFNLAQPGAGYFSTGTSGSTTSTFNFNTGIWQAIGIVSDLNNLLGNLQFIPTLNGNGNFTVSVTLSDGGSTNINSIFNVNGIPVNDSPILLGSSPQINYLEGDQPTIIDNTIAISDIDSENIVGATVRISRNYVSSEDELSCVISQPIVATFNNTSGVLNLNGLDTLANYQSALRQVKYRNLSNNPNISIRTVTFVVNDGESVNNFSNFVNATISITPINNPPQIILNSIGDLNYTANSQSVLLASDLVVSDSDGIQLAGALVKIVENYISMEDYLDFTASESIVASYNGGVLTMVGNAPLSDYQTLLRSVSYRNVASVPTIIPRIITFRINDGSNVNNFSEAVNVTIVVNKININNLSSETLVSTQMTTIGGSSISSHSSDPVAITSEVSVSSTGVVDNQDQLTGESANNVNYVIIGAAAGGVVCLAAMGAAVWKGKRYFANKNNGNGKNDVELNRFSSEMSANYQSKFNERDPGHASIRIDKGHTTIGGRFALINKISREEAENLYNQTGIKVSFDENKNKAKFLLGQGSFGKLRLALEIETGLFLGVKKIKGDKNIADSKNEGAIQAKLTGLPNIMPLYDSIETTGSNKEPVLYQFMLLAGFGNGNELQQCLSAAKNERSLKVRMIIHVAKSLLMAQQMHQRNIYHLDIKPANFVVDQNGAVYLIDFGCAQESLNGQIVTGTGDNRYFSPERYACVRKEFGVQDNELELLDSYNGAATDIWAVGVTLLELVLNEHPFDIKTTFKQRLSSWSKNYFLQRLEARFAEIKSHVPESLLLLLKGMLNINVESRLTAEMALAMPIFQDEKYQFNNPQELKEGLIYLKSLLKYQANSQEQPEDHDQYYAKGYHNVDRASTTGIPKVYSQMNAPTFFSNASQANANTGTQYGNLAEVNSQNSNYM